MLDLIKRPVRSLVSLIEQGWAHSPEQRPSFEQIVDILEGIASSQDRGDGNGGEGGRYGGGTATAHAPATNAGEAVIQEEEEAAIAQATPGEDVQDTILTIPTAKNDESPSAPPMM